MNNDTHTTRSESKTERRSRSTARVIRDNVAARFSNGAAGVAATASAATAAATAAVDPALLETAVDVLLHECACW